MASPTSRSSSGSSVDDRRAWNITDFDPSRRIPQSYYTFTSGEWRDAESLPPPPGVKLPVSLEVRAWNIDFNRALAHERMQAALDFLQRSGAPQVMMFNEMTAGALHLIQRQPWVRQSYKLTDLTAKNWRGNPYGTCMLIHSLLAIKQVFRVPYNETSMGRDLLFVDIPLALDRTLRVGTTHLESLRSNPPVRPGQLKTAADWMRQADAAILGGDMNAIEAFDREIHLLNGLKDAYIDNGGKEKPSQVAEGDNNQWGATWGQMAHTSDRERHGLGRLDKILYRGRGLEVDGYTTFGMDVVLEGEAGERLLELEDGLEKPWVTDHLGVASWFRLPDAQIR